MNPPLVTVGIPTYNRPLGLKRTLECITNQTYQNLEIIISDNCSRDVETEYIAHEFMARDPRVGYYRHYKNRGPVKNYKFLLQIACGKYFMWASDDDQWDPDFIQKLVWDLERYPPDHTVAMCNTTEIDVLRNVVRFTQYKSALKPGYSQFRLSLYAAGHDQITQLMYGLYLTDTLRNFMKNYDDSFASDILIINEMLLCERIGVVNEPLFTKYVHLLGTAQRYPDEAIGKSYGDPLNCLKLFLRFGPYLLKSPYIPLRRKLWIPVLWARHGIWVASVYPRQLFNYFVYRFQDPKIFDFDDRGE